MPILDLLQDAWEIYKKRSAGKDEPWASSEEAFEEHFDVPYTFFADSLNEIDRAQYELYEATVKVNPEAAIVWVLHLTN